MTNLAVTDRTDIGFDIGWTLPKGTVENTKITVATESTDIAVPTITVDTETNGDISDLDPNTQYTITAE